MAMMCPQVKVCVQLWLLHLSEGRAELKQGQWMAQKFLTYETASMEVKVNILWLFLWKEVIQGDLKGHLPELHRITHGLGRTVRCWLFTAPARIVNPGHQQRGQAHRPLEGWVCHTVGTSLRNPLPKGCWQHGRHAWLNSRRLLRNYLGEIYYQIPKWDACSPEGMQASSVGMGRQYLAQSQHIKLFFKVYFILIS